MSFEGPWGPWGPWGARNPQQMKNTKQIIVGLLLVFVSSAFGQDFLFRVVGNKGKNLVANAEQWSPVKAGSKLKKNQKEY